MAFPGPDGDVRPREVAQVLVELSVMGQRYQAVRAVVQDWWTVPEEARRLGGHWPTAEAP